LSSNSVTGINFRTSTNFSANSAYQGVNITNTQATGGFKIIRDLLQVEDDVASDIAQQVGVRILVSRGAR
jgi:hypothetical protein